MIRSSLFALVARVALLFAAAFLSRVAFAADVPAFPSDGGEAARLQPFVETNVIPGAVILVADKDKVLDLEALGYSDVSTKKPMKTTDLFYIASMTKTFTSAGLMMLVDEGKLKLDDPVEKYLPEFKGQTVQAEAAQPHPAKQSITIRQVMSHTAGLHGEPAKADTLEAYVKELAQRPLEFDPGTKYKYSPGPAVAGRIIEVVSGVPYPEFIQQRLLDPLALKDTSFWPDAPLAARLALTHELNPQTKALQPLKHIPGKSAKMPPAVQSQFGGTMDAAYEHHFANPAGGLFSTALDISRFCRMLLNGGVLEGKSYLSPAAFKEMTSLQTAGLTARGQDGYGLGCFIETKTEPAGPSLGSFGHHGARKTQMWIDPQNGLVMVLMVQCTQFTHEQQNALYAAYKQQAIAKYGKAAPRGTGAR